MRRWWAFASVAALFVSGVAIGALGMHVLDERHPPRPSFERPHAPRAAVEHLDRMLGLSAAQRDEITALLEQRWRAGEEIRREIQPLVDRHMADTHRQVRAILTPEQRERFDALLKEHGVPGHRLFVGPPGFPAHPPVPEEKPSPEGS